LAVVNTSAIAALFFLKKLRPSGFKNFHFNSDCAPSQRYFTQNMRGWGVGGKNSCNLQEKSGRIAERRSPEKRADLPETPARV
jgi:hypothetical protein